MPELPEVTTTVRGINESAKNLVISDVWTDYHVGTTSRRTDNIKDKKFFNHFKKEIVGEKIVEAERRAKYILIRLTHDKTILVHMKMTGHFLYGEYELKNNAWQTSEKGLLADPFNRFIHFIVHFKNGKSLAFSDMRKFASVTLLETSKSHLHMEKLCIGPEPLTDLTATLLKTQLAKKPNGKIKTVLMDQSIVAGIGNIYSDEILWQSEIHPERKVETLNDSEIKKMFSAMQTILKRSIEMGGDSMSDYRNLKGERGQFQNAHKAYRQTGKKCAKKGCVGIIKRIVIATRSTHFCPIHQK